MEGRVLGKNPQQSQKESEWCCASPDIVDTEYGTRVCRSCGVMHETIMVNDTPRAFTPTEIKNRVHTEPRWRTFGPRTRISQLRRDGKGNHLSAKRIARYRRLAKIQSSLIDSLERNFYIAKPTMKQFASQLDIPSFIVKTAWKIYQFVPKLRLTFGRSIKAFVAASIYTAVRIHEFPRLFKEVVDSVPVSKRKVHQAVSLIIRNILPKLGLKYHPIRVKTIIYRFSNQLDLSIRVQKRAVAIFQDAKENGLETGGKDPRGLAASAIYLAVRDSDEIRTQSQISVVGGITEVTLRSNMKKILETQD